MQQGKGREEKPDLWYLGGMRESARPLHQFLLLPLLFSQRRSPLPIRATTSSRTGSPRTRSHRIYIYIYIKPPFIRDNKQSCYRREINIVTFIRGQIEGANEPAIACVSLRSANQSFFHADKAFGRRLSPITRRPREQKRPIFPRLVAAAEDIPRNNRGCSGFQIETARFPRNSPPSLPSENLTALTNFHARRFDARVASDQYARGKCAVNTCGARVVADDCTRPPRVDRAFSFKERPVSHSVAHTNWIVHGVWKRPVRSHDR